MTEPVDVTRPAPHAPLAPIDPDVKIPDSVRAAAARAESYYKQAAPAAPPAAPEPPAQPPVQDATPPSPPPAEPPAQPPQQVAPPVQPEPPAQPPTPPPQQQVAPEQWEHRYNSMKGRYDQSQQVIAAMQEQMQQLGDELMRTQRMIQAPQQPQRPQPKVTDEDIQAYGPDLINMVQRAAVQAVSPELEAVKQENDHLRQTVTQTQKATVHQILDVQIPNWRDINRDPRFLRWLSLPDIYSGQLRRTMLNGAFQAAQAPRVVAFFKGFLQEEAATGHVDVPVVGQQQVTPPAPRQATIDIATLAAPGRPAPAGGQPPVAPDRPIYTRTQIADFYRQVREHRYAGREQEKARIEADIFAAQREGRVR